MRRGIQWAIRRLECLGAEEFALGALDPERPVGRAVERLRRGNSIEAVAGKLRTESEEALVMNNPCRKQESECALFVLQAALLRDVEPETRALEVPAMPEEEQLDGVSKTIRLYPSGILFSPFDPRPEDIHIEDVAHGLACTNRFNGHTAEPYSVAQHCLLVSLLCPAQPFWGLLHEVAEALSGLGDVCGPTKRHPQIRGPVKALEHRIESAAAIRFGLPEGFASDPDVKRADRIAYAWEDRDLRGLTTDDAWTRPLLAEIPEIQLVAMEWRDAERAFLSYFYHLESHRC